MNAFIASLQFITAIPLGKPRPFDPRGIVSHFPLAGLAIGLVLAEERADYIAFQDADVVVPLTVVECDREGVVVRSAVVGPRRLRWMRGPVVVETTEVVAALATCSLL